jgi:Lrp/AsnC family transcriptional regulator, leucine-responsive regulatory protein
MKQEKLNAPLSFHLFHMAKRSLPLDKLDRRLLALLQENNRRPLRSLAAEVGVSAPTCLRRVRRLESSGVIRANAALLDLRLLGYAVTAFVEITLANASGGEMSAFERRMRRCPEVTQCVELAGEVDYLVQVIAHDLPEFSDFTRRYFADDRSVRTYRSLLVMRETKSVHAVPV